MRKAAILARLQLFFVKKIFTPNKYTDNKYL